MYLGQTKEGRVKEDYISHRLNYCIDQTEHRNYTMSPQVDVVGYTLSAVGSRFDL